MCQVKSLFISAVIIIGISCNNIPNNNTGNNPLSINISNIDTTITADSIWLKTTNLSWLYDTVGFSTAYLIIAGNTNAKSIGIETHGDGVNSIFPLTISIDSSFNDTVAIGFSHVSGIFISVDTKILLYSNNNDTATITIINPK